MSALKYIFSFILILFLFLSCEDVDRNNLLDPKVEDGYRTSVVLVEAFVNTKHPSDYNGWAIEGLNRLNTVYGNKIAIAQYHRNIDSTYVEDPSFTNAELSQKAFNLQKRYINNYGEDELYTPDIFINGVYSRVSGASSVSSVELKVRAAINSKINLKNSFTLEPEVMRISALTYDISCRVARLGNQAMSNYKLKMIAIYDNKNYLGKQVVVDFGIKEIGAVEAGTYKTIHLGQYQFAYEPDAVIFSLCTKNELESLQCVKWEAK